MLKGIEAVKRFIKNIFEKLKNANPLYFLFGIIALILGVPLVVFISFYASVEFPHFAEDFVRSFKALAVLGVGLLVLVALFFLVLPILLFVIKRINCYFSLWLMCRKNGKSFKIIRFPFASLFGVKQEEDIKISSSEETYCVHFIDLVFRARRGFTLINENEYCIAKMRSDTRGLGGGFIKGQYNFPTVSSHSSVPKAYKTYTFPDFNDSKGKHIIIVHPTPNHCLFVDKTLGDKGIKPIYNGYNIGKIHYYSIRGFKKIL